MDYMLIMKCFGLMFFDLNFYVRLETCWMVGWFDLYANQPKSDFSSAMLDSAKVSLHSVSRSTKTTVSEFTAKSTKASMEMT